MEKNWLSTKKGGGAAKWTVVDGNILQCKPGTGDIITKAQFGDCQLHIEWSAPTEIKGNSQGRGNSGVFFMGRTEVQVLDNYNNPTYADGFAASVYGVNPPMANALNKPGEFNSYDIIFRRPIFKDGKEIAPGYLTVFCNGVLVQDHTPLEGGGGHKGRSRPRSFPEKGPLKLQDHGNTTRFRNIWYRPLPPRSIEGGTDGKLSPQAAAAKRKQIAADVRKDARKLLADGEEKDGALRLMESLIYDNDPEVRAEVTRLAEAGMKELGQLSSDELEAHKGEILQVRNAFNYMTQTQVPRSRFRAQKDARQDHRRSGLEQKEIARPGEGNPFIPTQSVLK